MQFHDKVLLESICMYASLALHRRSNPDMAGYGVFKFSLLSDLQGIAMEAYKSTLSPWFVTFARVLANTGPPNQTAPPNNSPPPNRDSVDKGERSVYESSRC